MAESSEDSEGEELELIRPGLIRELRNVLDEYPDDGQILKEMIQNAEDAGASRVKILADSREFHRQEDARTIKKHPHLKFFQGPALCVYNNEHFTEKDWEGIRMLHTSVKEKDPLKVGRFGLGFKSVFHLTDRLVIVSGEFIMYMDPFKGADRYCVRKRLAGTRGRELESLVRCLDAVFLAGSPHSLDRVFNSQAGLFSGTLFWFPLRRQESKLSDTLYTEATLNDLLQAFKAEANSMLMFLKNLEKIELYTRDAKETKLVFTVELSAECVSAVRAERSKFKDSVRAATQDLPPAPVCSWSEVEVQMSDRNLQHQSQNKERWLVVNYHAGKNQASEQLLRLCRDPNLSYQPYVGVAVPLGGQRNFQSHLFCFLPLPLETRSPTGLPVHVNGFFALSQNRRHIKWPTADQVHNRAHMEPALQWNCLLVEELLPIAYIALLHRLRELHDEKPDEFYKAWPDVTTVNNRWQLLVRRLYTRLSQGTFFHTSVPIDTWIPLSQAVLQNLPPSVEPQVVQAVIHIYTISNEKVVRLPHHVMSGLQQLSLENVAQTITPRHVSELVLTHHQYLHDEYKLLLLHYLCSHGNDLQLLFDRFLLPLQDGTFGAFCRRGKGKEVLLCEKETQVLFPGLENMMCSSRVSEVIKNHLKNLAKSGQFSLRVVIWSDVPRLLEMSIQTRFRGSSLRLSSQDSWIQQVWLYLKNSTPWNADLSGLCHLALLPCLEGHQIKLLPLKGIYVSLSAPGMSQINKDLSSSLSKLGITVVSLPQYVCDHKQILGGLVHYPNSRGILEVLEKVSTDPTTRTKAESDFHRTASEADISSLITFIANAKQLEPRKVSVLTGLRLFIDMTTKQFVSVREVNVIGPRDPLPVLPPRSLLMCDESSRSAALKIGASEVTLHTICQDILKYIQYGSYTDLDIKRFMKYFLSNAELMAREALTALARNVTFVPSSSGKLHKPSDMYYFLSKDLRELFLGEDLFPCDEFAQDKFISELKKLGLRDETTVKEDDLVSAAQSIENLFTRGDKETATRKAEGLWALLLSHGHQFNLSRLTQIQCMPCLQNHQKPSHYPNSLPLRSDPAIVKPCDMVIYSHLIYCGSTKAVMRPGISENLTDSLKVSKLILQDVLTHLLNVVSSYDATQSPYYKYILHEVFKSLKNCRNEPSVSQLIGKTDCVFVESEGRFACPKQFWVKKRSEDIDLSPYRFPLHNEMSDVSDLLLKCGSSECQDDKLLQEVLNEIKTKHETGSISKPEFTKDLRLVKQILDVLKESDSAASGWVLVPISHERQDLLQFRYAKECTIWSDSLSVTFAVDGNEDEDIIFVHREISKDTALRLGVLEMKERALTGIEDLDFDYGQHEDLTDRLHNLLKDSYTDGFSVPKELIQNADDAGATEVKFLLDERENRDARTNLINEQMASLQGPALWAFNNASFSDEDFKNIVRLGAGTKRDDVTKVGKFGLGFNSVYNLTDVPSFISRHTLAMFDPHVKYLKGPGLKLDFRKPVNRALLVRMPEQFKPFQGVFGCALHKEREVQYNGTLFRFPLRTEDQASDSKIKKEAYSESKRRNFIKMLLERVGNLLTFTQNVKKLEIYYLSSTSTNPVDAECILTLKRNSQRAIIAPLCSDADESVVQFTTKYWHWNRDVRLTEDIVEDMTITNSAKLHFDVNPGQSKTQWRISWASGVNQSAHLAEIYRHEKHIPLAAVSVLLNDGHIASLSETPFGFYKSGHLFCFLPLPEEMVRFVLPVHVNGTFSLTSSRRSLLAKTEDDVPGMPGDEWNRALFADAVCRAYVLLLESLHKEAMADLNFHQYFLVFPKADCEPSLMRHFYAHLVNKENQLLPVPRSKSWVCFRDARFMDPDFRVSDVGEIAWDALNHFWGKMGESLVHVSADFHHQIIAAGQEKSIRERTITQIIFYRHCFFPNINDKTYWTDENRDKLVMYALMHADPNIRELVKHSCCIPCLYTNELRSPKDLIDPHGEAAKLFWESEARFPQNANNLYPDRKRMINFCSSKCLSRLVELGMVKDDLPWHMVIERAKTIGNLIAIDTDKALSRASALIDYLAHRKGYLLRIASCPQDVLASLSNIRFLPVLRKPEDWPFPWEGNNTDSVLYPPIELFSDSLKELVACKVKLIDSKVIGLNNWTSKLDVLRSLGLKVGDEKANEQMLHLVIGQLTLISEKCTTNSKINIHQILNICQCIYRYLSNCVNEPDETLKQIICSSLYNTAFIWVGSGFVPPSRVAFLNKYNCQPFLFELQRVFLPFSQLFKAVGVKNEFETQDILLVLQEINKQNVGGALSDDTISVVCQLAELLHDAARRTREDHCLKDANVYLPDRHGHMQHVSCLCLDDCDWVRESETMKFVHGRISPEVAGVLGVKSKRVRDVEEMFNSIAIPFGQHEELTTRIRRLLEGYTCDSSIFYELVQNADDAGATEIKFIKDFRSLHTERVPLGWESLQGPALCVYNNKSFTAEDIKGIQSLGIGSKREDMLKTGKYGVGFNAVYHITDVPSFWTREDDKNDVVCIFDPNCEYAAGATSRDPGKQVTDVNRLRENYPDMFAGYLGNYIDMKQPGTLFRFPLRHEEMAKKSQIKKDIVMKQDDIVKLIETFKKQMSMCILFLNNIRTIGVYAVSDNDELLCEYKVTMTIEDDINKKQFADFQRQVSQSVKDVKNKTSHISGIQPFEVVIKANIGDSKGLSEEYLIVNMVGVTATITVSRELNTEWQKEHFRILPRGGVAVKLKSKNQIPSKVISEKHLAFCFLPLPVETSLPVYVNGNFALDHETRRDLWTKKDDVQTEWNTLIATGVIVPAYIRAIEAVKKFWFHDKNPIENEINHFSMLNFYHHLFPDPSKAPSDFWRMLMKFLYKELSDKELPLFPVVFSDTRNMEWVSAVRRDAFPGYFSNLEWLFKKQYPPLSVPSLMPTSQHDMARKRAQELTSVLKDINMKILYAPYKIFQYFVESGVQEVKEVTPENVIIFLKSATHRRSDGCCVTDLPQPVGATRLKTCENIKALLNYVKDAEDFLSQLDGLPLCLRQSQAVYVFEKSERKILPFVSIFLHLLPGSYDSFVHESIMGMFLHISEKTKDLLRDLDIPSLTLMLPASLPEKQYKTGLSWAYNLHILQAVKSWFTSFWNFVGTQIKRKNQEGDIEFRRRSDKALECLAQWTLIPAVKGTGDATQRMLYPVRDLHLVVYIQSSPTEYHPRMWHILKNLPVPFLDMECLHDSNKQILVDLVASVSHPYALLHALASLANIGVSVDDACEVLQYFSNTLSVLQDYCSEENSVCDKLKRLPFFVTVNGETLPLTTGFSVLILSDDIPSSGLKEWSLSQKKILLRANYLPDKLTQFLCLSQPSLADFYVKFLLPTLTALPKSDILKHMTCIKNNMNNFNRSERERLVQQLKVTAFLEKDGLLCRASEFFSPHEPVFVEFCNSSSLPPAPYNGREWQTLMMESGMVCDVSRVKFFEFARCVEEDGKRGISRIVEKRSHLLVNHLFSREDLREDHILRDVRGICFVLPATLDEIYDGTFLKIIAKPPNANRLVSFNESCQVQHAHLIWSSSFMLKESLNPVRLTCHRQDQKEILQELQFGESAPIRKVIEHTRNICSTLASEKGPEIFSILSQKSAGLLTKIMMNIYEFFSKNEKKEDIEVLKMLPVICDVENEKMMRPETVVIDLRPEEAIAGEVEKAPTMFGQFFPFFQKLGVDMNVTANSYAKVLLRLKNKTKDEILNVQELNIVKKAVEGLFRCLKSETKETKNLSVSHLFLPNRRKSLDASTNLIFVDSKALGKRFKESLADAQFFLGFRSLEIKVLRPLDEVKLLPDKHQMKRFSHIVREIIPDDIKSRAFVSEQSRRVESKVHNPIAVNAILWFVYEKHQKQNFEQFLNESRTQITECLTRITVKEVENLHTVLYFNGAIVENSREEKAMFEDTMEDTYRMCTVYLDQKVCNDIKTHHEELCQSLFLAVQFVLNTELDRYCLTKVLGDPAQAMKLFEKEGLHIFDLANLSDYSVFPTPGSFIPVEEHCFLDNSFHQYSEGEYVGFEIYDPAINDDDEAEVLLDTSECEANPVYIYAVVRGMERESEQRKLPPLSRKYRIFLGHEKGYAVVSVLRLYKFVRKEKTANSHKEVSDGSETYQEKTAPHDIKAVLRKIRETLIEAWQLPDEADRRRIIKRLILTWHPDKNRDNEAFCTRVMQMLNHYIERLGRGEKIRIDEDEDEQEHVDSGFYTTSASSSFSSSTASSSSSSSSYSHFFDFMKRRAEQHRDYYQSSSCSSTPTPNKQTGEGRRWFRQAQADLRFAHTARDSFRQGHNWICYHCHQAVEKAIKAVLFSKDANSFPETSHDIALLASLTGDSEIIGWAREIENIVGFHTRMRYPDALTYPSIPDDVYTADQANQVCSIASSIVHRVESLL